MSAPGGIQVVGTRVGDLGSPASWAVLVLVGSAGGFLEQVALTPAEAERVAEELTDYARLCRREHAALEKRQAEKEACR